MLFIAVLFIITAAYVSYIVKPWKFSFLKNVIEQTLPYKKWGGKIAKCMYFMIDLLFCLAKCLDRWVRREDKYPWGHNLGERGEDKEQLNHAA